MGGSIWRFGIRQLSLPDREYLFLFTVKSIISGVSKKTTKNPQGKQSFQLGLHGKLNATTLSILKSDGLFAASQS